MMNVVGGTNKMKVVGVMIKMMMMVCGTSIGLMITAG